MNKIINSSENIVPFPNLSNKEHGKDGSISEELLNEAQLYSSDPLEDLLNEFEDASSTSTENEETTDALTKIVDRMKLPEELLAQEFSHTLDLKTKMSILEEVNKRIKYFLDEVEPFIPKQKK